MKVIADKMLRKLCRDGYISPPLLGKPKVGRRLMHFSAQAGASAALLLPAQREG